MFTTGCWINILFQFLSRKLCQDRFVNFRAYFYQVNSKNYKPGGKNCAELKLEFGIEGNPCIDGWYMKFMYGFDIIPPMLFPMFIFDEFIVGLVISCSSIALLAGFITEK